ncbi:phosphatidate cytidylyltransferase [Candidatus Pelagibacter sp. Uisw_099_02]|uniref:phosphatidate cytidylyltransferase n=1 Tax=Candidatus Pelagibacter sp. Uisw_099_02 TaxID=3230981 RepID=UPI00236E848E|nr:phosphatidate cytidylyltransferase [Candidatus Pelagibacter sp.]|tara:strand:+ start:526 stop:1188 length:663 start_codon:yes stop_codon:yes gene_type:complete
MGSELKKRIVTSLLLLLLLTIMYFFSFMMIISLIVIAIIIWIEFYALLSKIFIKNSINHKFYRFIFKSISLLYLSLLVYYLFYIESYHQDLKVYLIYSILVAILSDIGGLVIGKFFKGKKLTKISPNKTVSGSIGSFVFSLFLIPLFNETLIKYDLLILIVITLFISLTTQIGDLLISYIKRKAKVKNTSDLLPGHGGILDRVDGIIFAIPIGLLLFNIF